MVQPRLNVVLMGASYAGGTDWVVAVQVRDGILGFAC
jgi:hypothetical protein